ncbi:MAG TPA: serine hydrolase domain-containing protein, partial [Dongiaceae bacterium]
MRFPLRSWVGLLLTSFVLLAVIPVARAGQAGGEQRLQAISGVVREEIQAGHIPGAVVVVGIGGRIVYRQAFGLRAITPRQAPMTVDTIFDLASLTKVIATTTAIMQLAERGLIDLDKPVAAYWPAFAGGGKGAITIRELLTHYSAMPPDLPAGGWSGYGDAMAKIESIEPVKTPGSFVYSDIDFAALGEIVRRVSGLSLDAYARRYIFAPLGMRDTMFIPPPALLDRIAPADIENGVLRWGSVQDP